MVPTMVVPPENIINDKIDEKQNEDGELIEDFSDYFAEDFDFLKESKRDNNLKAVESIANIQKDNDNNFDEYIKDCIQDLENFSSIFCLEDLIFDPEYTLKSFMKSLKQVINFKYFYTKFTIPKEKKEHKGDKKKNQNSFNIESKNKKKNKKEKKHDKTEQNTNNNTPNKKGTNTETEIKDKDEEGKASEIRDTGGNKESKVEKIKFEDGNIHNIDTNDKKKNKKVGKPNKNEQTNGSNVNNVKGLNEEEEINNIKKEERKTSEIRGTEGNEETNVEKQKNNDKNNQSGGKILSKKKKSDLLSKLFQRDSKNNISIEINRNNKSLNSNQSLDLTEKSKSEDDNQMKISSSQTSNEKNSTVKDNKSTTSKDETFSKYEEYKSIKSDIVLYIINNKANIEEGELVEGKNYESKVRKYFQIVLDICSDKSFPVYKNYGTPIEGLYKYYENLIQRNKIQINLDIKGNSKEKEDYNKLEFDLMVDHVKKKIIDNIIDIFKSSIIAKNNVENLEESTEYQIVGEVGKNILNQSIEKNKQIGKIIDILLIEQYLTYEDLTDKDNPFKNQVIKEYDNLKLDINEKKIVFLFTNGSFVELKKALLFNIYNDKKQVKDYDDFDIKTIFPIKNKRRYAKNIIHLQLIIKRLNESKIPYIIFYIGEELNNGIERILINHIKNKKDTEIYNTIITKIKEYENLVSKNISQSFLIKRIDKSLKILNKNEIFNKIKNIIDVPLNKKNEYFDFIFKNLIEIKKLERKNYILIFFINGLKISDFYKIKIKNINDKSLMTHIELVNAMEEDILVKYSKYKDKNINIIKTFIVTDVTVEEKKQNNEKIFKFDIDFEVKDFRNIFDINFGKIDSDYIKEILKNYLISNYIHFSEEKYLDAEILHKKIMYDLKNLENDFPIKCKKIIEDKIFVEKAKCLINEIISNDIVEKKSGEIFLLIKNCIGKNLYKYLLEKREKYINSIIIRNLKNISTHIFCFSIYEKFFMDYFFLELSTAISI